MIPAALHRQPGQDKLSRRPFGGEALRLTGDDSKYRRAIYFNGN